ncbi:MAG: hypothetical protein JNJ63_05880 [Hyphomonadaceae bacterium]|nr:hypothetical protein [Hyphomonadaceae bacterium]
MRPLIILPWLVVLSACLPSGPDYPTREGAAGAIARAGYFGEISEHYDEQILAAHPEIRGFVRAVLCSESGAAAACVVTFSNGRSHELGFCRCGGGGVHEWSTYSDIDDPDIPKIKGMALSEDDVRRQLREARQDAVERRNIVNDAIKGYYRRLGRRERQFADRELSSWILQSDDPLMREQALRMVDELHIVAALPAVDALIARSTEADLTYGYTGIGLVTPLTDVRAHLADPHRRSF